MTTYAFVKLAHVMTAVIAMGLVTAAVILSRASAGISAAALRPIVRGAAAGLLLMLVTGALMDYLVAGAWHGTRFFRIGVGWTLATGACLGYSRRTLARATTGTLDAERARRRLLVASSIALACVVMTVGVMVRRP
jgi:hypothetical protein